VEEAAFIEQGKHLKAATMNDLVRREALPLEERMQMARALAESSLLPRDYANNPANVLVAIDYTIGLGLDPGLAVNVVDVIDGRPHLKSSTMQGMVRAAGHKLRIWGDEKSATCQIIRADDPEFKYETTWTIEMAERAGLIRPKSAWVTFPRIYVQGVRARKLVKP
jgi:hypothetical protein